MNGQSVEPNPFANSSHRRLIWPYVLGPPFHSFSTNGFRFCRRVLRGIWKNLGHTTDYLCVCSSSADPILPSLPSRFGGEAGL